MDEHAPLDNLITMLKLIDESDLPDVKYEDGDVYLSNVVKTHEKYKELINKLVEIADQALIDDEGHCVWESILEVKSYGYQVFAGEQDRWGWLTGCIQTKKGLLVYG